MGPSDLAQVLRHLPASDEHEKLLVGLGTNDDGGVYQLKEDLAIVQSIDYFTPICDDPYMFGQIAAANALSDIYAMGGTPITVLNIVGYPIKKASPEVLAGILRGGADKAAEAGAVIAGGHSIDDKEPKYGMSCTGTVHPDRIFKNVGAKPGHVLVLTKPLGGGIISTAIKRKQAADSEIDENMAVMAELNKTAAETLEGFHPSAVTDVTGFGLLGHAYEMTGGEVTFHIDYETVPVLAGAKKHAENGIAAGGAKDNRAYLADFVDYHPSLSESDELILCDTITSGGLLISLPADEADAYIEAYNSKSPFQAQIIGSVTEKSAAPITVNHNK
nr:selenide, water dikinase SelD [Salisediminibacterium haloalkalitolerans]